ncbi:response regulator [Desulfococcaceae bacterium HSG8]|nr:response regulator [Desulfococcaceae bacterium HSG8]
MYGKLSKQYILIVDDSPSNIKILAETLMSDYGISVATNGPDALEIVTSKRRFDLILLDIMMPEMDGYEVCRRLKNDESTFNIPIVFITAKTEEKDETKGFEIGAVDYITKPFNPVIVRARVRTHLDLKRYRDHLEDMVKERTTELTISNEKLQQEIMERRLTQDALRKSHEKLEFINEQLQSEIEERKRAQKALRKSHEDLEKRVEERTAELLKSNDLLKQEIAERKRSEKVIDELSRLRIF